MELGKPDPNIEPIPYMVIPLTQGQIALVDKDDYSRVSKHKWSATFYINGQSTSGVFYAVRSDVRDGKRVCVLLHRFVMEAPSGVEVDHINRNHTLDCRKSNLRLATHVQNMRNRRKTPVPTSSHYKGVCKCIKTGKWKVNIRLNSRQTYLGSFYDEAVAARVYNAAATRHFGEFALLNTVEAGPLTEDARPKKQWARAHGLASSGYRGVYACNVVGRWVAQLVVSGKKVYLGRYATKAEAASAYNAAATLHFGQFALLNKVD